MYTPEDTTLLLDVMLGGIVSSLRMVGYDTAYALDRSIEADEVIIDLAAREGRLLLTRDREVAARADRSHLLKELDPQDQLAELAQAEFELELEDPRRCSTCNGRLRRVRRGQGPADGPDPSEESVWQCRACGQHYWKGSHWENLAHRLDRL